MVVTVEEYKVFLKNNREDDLFFHIILSDDKIHPTASFPIIFLVQNFRTKDIYHFVLNHQDDLQVVDFQTIIKDISTFEGRLFVLDKKSFIQKTGLKNVLDVNLALHLENQKIINFLEFETNAHRFLRQNYFTYASPNQLVPLVKHKETVQNIFSKINNINKSLIINEKYFLEINSKIVEPLSEIESHGIYVDEEKFSKYFDVKVDKNGFVYSQYNLYTTTGRPSNSFGGVNYAALNKNDGCRECFVSRFGKEGKIVLIDYSAFHPRIICELTNFKLSTDTDFYSYIAKLCFKKEEVDSQDISDAKSLTFRQLFGGVEEKYSHIQFFYNLKGFINSHWEEFQEMGFTKTPLFGRKFLKEQILHPNPPKLFNYILQSTETEISAPILGKVNDFLRDKQSKTVLFTYDSILFDVHINELDLVKKEVVDIMKDNNRFPVKFYMGKSYADIQQTIL